MQRKTKVKCLATLIAKDLQIDKAGEHSLCMFLERCSDDLLTKAGTETKFYHAMLDSVRQDQNRL